MIAKGKVIIRFTNDLEKDFTRGWKFYKAITNDKYNSRIYRKVQLSRTEVQAATSGYVFWNKNKLKTKIVEGLYTAKLYGYKRYYLTTKSMLKDSKEKLEFDLNQIKLI